MEMLVFHCDYRCSINLQNGNEHLDYKYQSTMTTKHCLLGLCSPAPLILLFVVLWHTDSQVTNLGHKLKRAPLQYNATFLVQINSS